MNQYYTPPNQTLWTGREVAPHLTPQYWYQTVEFVDLSSLEPSGDSLAEATVLLGYAVDEGVRRNQGRVGAAAGPDTARPYLGRLANHSPGHRVVDAGTITCPDGNLEAAQQELSERIEQICRRGGRPLVIGGGHDVAYGHFRGLHGAYNSSGTTFGIVNFDAHLDLRSPAAGPTSGTPFHQILDETGAQVRYLAVGIQPEANPPVLYETAKQFGVSIITEAEVLNAPQQAMERLEQFADSVDHLYITVDVDGFNAGIAPGVSAPNPSGFSAPFVLTCLRRLLANSNVIGADIAEFNPAYDRDGVTARLVSRLVYALATNQVG